MESFVTHLSCSKTGESFKAGQLLNLSRSGKPLRVEYDLRGVASKLRPEVVESRGGGLWAWRELLPLPLNVEPADLGEGGTPLIPVDRLASELGFDVSPFDARGRLWIKDESVNPTGSFKSRGMAVAVAMAKSLGAGKLAVPSAGNAGGALAAYAAAYGIEAHICMPRDVPAANRLECELYGARVTLVDGLITDCAARVRAGCAEHGWFDLSTLREPYRVEGKKTLGLEMVLQLRKQSPERGVRVPDVIVYPTGGGTGLIGMAKAFDELEGIGWIGSKRPRFVCVQADGCQPIVRAFAAGESEAAEHASAYTLAAGLRVPKAIGDFIMLDILRRTKGTAVSIRDEEMLRDAYLLSAASGVCACPEGGACLSAVRVLRRSGWILPTDEVVLFNTASGLKYGEAFAAGRSS